MQGKQFHCDEACLRLHWKCHIYIYKYIYIYNAVNFDPNGPTNLHELVPVIGMEVMVSRACVHCKIRKAFEAYHNMTVWILAGNGIFFHGSGLNLATYVRRQVITCVTKASACHYTLYANHWHPLREIPPIIGVKSNIITVNQVRKFIVNMIYYGRFIFRIKTRWY